jgi:tight adherence protein B
MLVGIAAAIAASLLLQTLVSFGLALAGGVSAGLVLTRTLFGWQRDRYADRLLRQLPDMLQIVMSVVRAGLPVSEAFRIVAREMPEPTCSEFALVAEELALGHSADIALLGVHRRTGVSEFAIFSVTLSVQAKSGGGLVETIQNLADTLRERIALSGRATALSGEARLSSQILTAFPFVMAAALSVLHPGFFSPLLGDPRGRMLLAFALLCLVVGNIVMRMMIKKGTAV